jgi:hypothetical protein
LKAAVYEYLHKKQEPNLERLKELLDDGKITQAQHDGLVSGKLPSVKVPSGKEKSMAQMTPLQRAQQRGRDRVNTGQDIRVSQSEERSKQFRRYGYPWEQAKMEKADRPPLKPGENTPHRENTREYGPPNETRIPSLEERKNYVQENARPPSGRAYQVSDRGKPNPDDPYADAPKEGERRGIGFKPSRESETNKPKGRFGFKTAFLKAFGVMKAERGKKKKQPYESTDTILRIKRRQLNRGAPGYEGKTLADLDDHARKIQQALGNHDWEPPAHGETPQVTRSLNAVEADWNRKRIAAERVGDRSWSPIPPRTNRREE